MIYFAYGSNMEQTQMKTRCPGESTVMGGPASLSGYTLCFTRWSRSWDSGTADILPERGKEVWGVIHDLTLDNLRRMDQFADYPNSYIRQDVLVQQDGITFPAFTYVAIRQGVFAPSKKYIDKIIAGAAGNHLPESYLSFLRSIETHD